MDINRRSVLSCRGCLKEVNEDQFYSFVRQEHKDLFTECTAIKISSDEMGLPQQICFACHSMCSQWKTFRNMCLEVDTRLRSTTPLPDVLDRGQATKRKREEINAGHSDQRTKGDEEEEEDCIEVPFEEEDPLALDETEVMEFEAIVEPTEEELSHAVSPGPNEEGLLHDDPPEPLQDNSAVLHEEEYLHADPPGQPQEELAHYFSPGPLQEEFLHADSPGLLQDELAHHVSPGQLQQEQYLSPAPPEGHCQLDGKDNDRMDEDERRGGVLPVARFVALNGPMSCILCDTVCANSEELGIHFKAHYSVESPKCPICEESFHCGSLVYPHVIAEHINRNCRSYAHHPTVQRNALTLKECPLCSHRTTKLLDHLLKAHSRSGKRCPLCETHLATIKDLKAHVRLHTREELYPCSTCGVAQDSIRSRVAHNQQFHKKTPRVKGGKRKRFACPVCRSGYHDLKGLHEHFVEHTDEHPFACPHCPVVDQTIARIKTHIRSWHPEVEAINEAGLLKSGSLFEHPRPWEAMGYFNVTSKPKQPNERSKHKERNEDPRLFKCPLCTEVYPTLMTLHSHFVNHATEQQNLLLSAYYGVHSNDQRLLQNHIATMQPNMPVSEGVTEGGIFTSPCQAMDIQSQKEVEGSGTGKNNEGESQDSPISDSDLNSPSIKKEILAEDSQSSLKPKVSEIKKELCAMEVEECNNDNSLAIAKEERVFLCPYCNMDFGHRGALQTHIRGAHKGQR